MGTGDMMVFVTILKTIKTEFFFLSRTKALKCDFRSVKTYVEEDCFHTEVEKKFHCVESSQVQPIIFCDLRIKINFTSVKCTHHNSCTSNFWMRGTCFYQYLYANANWNFIQIFRFYLSFFLSR